MTDKKEQQKKGQKGMGEIKRCRWCNLNNPLYVEYHDNEWGRKNTDDRYLFEMLILESFQAGLSWECVLNKRENFRKAFDDFDAEKVAAYDEEKLLSLAGDPGIIRNRLKIAASVNNANIFLKLQEEYGSFWNYLNRFIENRTIYEIDKATNELSDKISADLKKRGMKFVGSTIIYAYLQAIGVIYSHDECCSLYRDGVSEDK